MSHTNIDTYKDWKIRVHTCEFACSHFSFDLTDPCDQTKRIPFIGKTREEAIEKAREMIDLETSSGERCFSS